MKPIPYGRQFITDEDIQEVIKVLKSDYLTQGPKIIEFEQAFAKYVGSKFAVAVANGTAALHLCALAIGVKPGNKVITTPISFAASANCIRYCGGEVVFADIDPNTYLIDINKVRELLEGSPVGTYSGIIPVDFAGRAVNLEEFRNLANEFNLWIIEDACHAPGGFFNDHSGVKQLCGNGKFAELAIFSFHPVKHIATGEGGMITTNDSSLYESLLNLRTHGITRNQNSFINDVAFASANPHATEYPGWYMEMQDLGFNYRITDFQSALGLSQLKRADDRLIRRRSIAKKYDEEFRNHPHIFSHLSELKDTASGHAYHLYIIETTDRLGLYNYLQMNSIYAQVHYIPTHLMPYYRQFGWKDGDMPHAERYYSRCLSIPMFPSLSDTEQGYVIQTIKAYCHE
jgi:UDP-4-amino-4,6-dideoxy-N-acetyl-beta-L-altrosamine transaminase